jgi:hypothetical protein
MSPQGCRIWPRLVRVVSRLTAALVSGVRTVIKTHIINANQQCGRPGEQRHMNPIAIIPTRLASSRLPGNALKDITGMPMIAHV